MNKVHPYLKLTTSLFIFISLLTIKSCDDSGSRDERKTRKPRGTITKMSHINSPLHGENYVLGDVVPIKLNLADTISNIDSVQFLINDKLVFTAYSEDYSFNWPTEHTTVGRNRIRTVVYFPELPAETNNTSVIILSDKAPVNILYRHINTYPHDTRAYTQGLVYEDGYLYESTGQYGQSTLRKVELKTGQVVKSVNLPSNMFGEGLALFNNKLLQITWKERVGIVYDKETFQELDRVYYANNEGWGLAFDGEKFIFTDGSETLYFFDTKNFEEIARIDVYDNNGPVNRLNELAYINGEIYANIFGSTRVAIINPNNGKVTGTIELAGLVPEGLENDSDKVMNGIAYNPETSRLYISGKMWPYLYEIELIGKW